jgi:integrase
MLEPKEIRTLLDAADVQMRAMLLLGINCGFGGGDCAALPLEALDLERGWVDFPRPKNGIDRRCPLWEETTGTLRAWLAEQPEPRDSADAGLVFLTTRRRPWLSRGVANPISVAARRLMKDIGVHRAGIGFYTLRHVFRTIADEARDPVAIDLVMGHSDRSMGATYRERVDDARLRAVVAVVHAWLFREAQP